jgi:hypothetical protein
MVEPSVKRIVKLILSKIFSWLFPDYFFSRDLLLRLALKPAALPQNGNRSLRQCGDMVCGENLVSALCLVRQQIPVHPVILVDVGTMRLTSQNLRFSLNITTNQYVRVAPPVKVDIFIHCCRMFFPTRWVSGMNGRSFTERIQ